MDTSTYVFIDSQNLYMGVKDQGWALDYKKFYVYLREKYKADKVMIYIGYLKGNEGLYKSLKSVGYELVFKNTKQFGKNRDQVKGNIDVDLTVDAIKRASEYSNAVFVSADGDFVALYDYLIESLDKELLILVPNMHKYSSFLLKYKGQLRFMNDLKTKLGKA